MSKYSKEFKLEVVKYCIEKHHSSYDAAKEFSIPSPTPIKLWIRKYKEHGIEGLFKQQKSSYSGEFKQNVIEYMHTNHLSVTETSIHFRLEISAEMRNRGYIINHKTVARLMKIMGLQSIQRPKRRYNSYQGTIGKIPDNTNLILHSYQGWQYQLKQYQYLLKEKQYKNIEELEKDIVEYIEYYNNRRIKSKLKGMSPVQYREHSNLVA